MSRSLLKNLSRIMGKAATEVVPLGGGCIFGASRVRLADGSQVVVKQGAGPVLGQLGLEGWMLDTLKRAGWPVPDVLHREDDLLVMEWIENDGGMGAATQADAGHRLAQLHQQKGPSFGLDRDTVIGALVQPNEIAESWIPFFRDQRLGYMIQKAWEEGSLPTDFRRRLVALSDRLEDYLVEPEFPALLHGDMWGGNVLVRNGRIAAFIDPAIYYGHPEIELAFSTLFGTFNQTFFEAYEEISPLGCEFFDIRRDLYNLYPLLVHVRLFGSSYLSGIDQTLKRVGL